MQIDCAWRDLTCMNEFIVSEFRSREEQSGLSDLLASALESPCNLQGH